MLDNYTLTEHNIIKQNQKEIIKYNKKYIDRYNTFDKTESIILNSIRYSFTIASNKGVIPDSILDVGYGNGDFLNICKRTIKNCYGSDINPHAILPEGCNKITNLEGNYEIITFFDSLEHFENIDFIKNLKCKIIIISVPWCHWKGNEDDDWFSEWKHRKPNEHLFHFNDKSLFKFMNDMGYDPIIPFSNIEDIVRKNKNNEKNILTSSWRKK